MWFDPVEQAQLFALLDELAPVRCLEWGCGGSTRAILERHASVESYLSIEHDPAWYRRVAREVTDRRLDLRWAAPNRPLEGTADAPSAQRIAWDAQAEVDPEILRDYVELPAHLGGRFDFVLVDGRARRFCLRAGFDQLDAGGALALHDAQRESYRDALESLGPVEFFEPWVQGQLAVVRKG